MFWCRKDGKGECTLSLKKLMGSRKKARVELSDGMLFVDEVVGVITEEGRDYAVFATRPKVAVASIELLEIAA